MKDAVELLGNLTRKYQVGAYSVSTYPQPKVAERASRIAAQRQRQPMRRQPITEEDEALLDRLEDLGDLDDDEQQQPATISRTRRQQQEPTSRPAARGVSRPPMRRQQQQQGSHRLVWIACGMLLLLVGWSAILHLIGWYVNTIQDPGTYTQAAHRDSTVITDAQGHITQIRAFVDTEQHLDLLILPVGSPDKAKIMRGPVLSNFTDPQHAMISVFQSSRGTITVVAQSALIVDWLTAGRQTAQWNADVSTQPNSSKGGK